MQVASIGFGESSNANLKAELANNLESETFLMWGVTWHSQSIPIPIKDFGWHFESRMLGGVLEHKARKLRIWVQAPMFEPLSDDWLSLHMSKYPDLPKPSLSKFELLTLALKITPHDVRCDASALQQTVNRLAALYTKRMDLNEATSAYFMPKGAILLHLRTKYEEKWQYLFETSDSDLVKEITIHHWSPGEFDNLGFYIRPSSSYTYSSDQPAFLAQEFRAHEKNFPSTVLEYRQAMENLYVRIKN